MSQCLGSQDTHLLGRFLLLAVMGQTCGSGTSQDSFIRLGGQIMSVITPRPLSHYPWWVRIFFWKQRRTYGQILTPGLLWGAQSRSLCRTGITLWGNQSTRIAAIARITLACYRASVSNQPLLVLYRYQLGHPYETRRHYGENWCLTGVANKSAVLR